AMSAILVLLLLTCLTQTPVAARPLKAEVVSKEVSFGKLGPDIVARSLIFSSDAQHIAYVQRRAGKKVAVLDGRAGKAYEDIPEIPLSEAGRPPELKFSPDGSHLAYVAKAAGKSFLVVDGAEGKPYDSIQVGAFYFSPDSKRIAFLARRDGKEIVVVDGV